MNAKFDMKYLAGGDDVFGPELSAAPRSSPTSAPAISPSARTSARFIKNLKFTLPMENEVMGAILFDSKDPGIAAERMAEGATPTRWSAWLAGVTTFDGQPGLDAVKKSLGL